MEKLKRIILLIFVLDSTMYATAQNNIDGIYSTDSAPYYIVVEDKNMYFVYGGHWVVDCTTLAICTYEWVSTDFIEINSAPVKQLVLDSMITHTIYNQQVSDDSLRVNIRMPYDGPVDIDFYCNTYSALQSEDYSIKSVQGRASVTLPRHAFPSLSIDIRPELDNYAFRVLLQTIRGTFWGTMEIPLIDVFSVPNDVNVIDIDFPNMDICLFHRYNIRGEFIHIEHNKLIWRGNTYKKMHKYALPKKYNFGATLE